MRMTAAVMYEQGLPAPFEQSKPFRIEEVELEGPGPGEVLVEVRAAGLCHSDLSQVEGLRKRKCPVVGGHEAAGIVREVGKGVTSVKPGDHAVMTAVSGCGECRVCRAGRPALCNSVTSARTQGLLGSGQVRLSRNGKPIYHYSGISGFAQYAVTMAESLVPIDAKVPLDVAAIFGCAVLTGAGAVLNAARIQPGATVAVVGLGGVGLNAVMAAKVANASRIIALDVRKEKFPLALELGATDAFVASDPNTVQAVRDLTGGGVDFTFEMSGVKAAVANAVSVTRAGGEVVLVGLGASNQMYEYNHSALVIEEKVLRGCFMGTCVPNRDIPRYAKLFLEGKMPIDRLQSQRIGFDTLNRSLDLLQKGEVVRQILMPHP